MDSPMILVVDDDSDFREYLRVCLDELGYQSVEAATGEDALKAMRQDRPRVVLLDVHMPGMDGPEVAEQMGPRAPPVVFLTSSNAEDLGAAMHSQKGTRYYLPKGASREELSLMLQSLAA